MTDIKRMRQQTANFNSSPQMSASSAHKIVSSYFYRASLLSALLLSSGGAMTLTARANPAPSTVTTEMAQGAKVVYVNPDSGTDSPGAGTNTQPLHTITKALQQAEAGTVIQLAKGSYTAKTGEVFPLVVPQGVTLRGDESTKGDTVAIIGGGDYTSILEATQNVTIVAQQDSVISGLTITNPNTRGTGLWIESINATVKNNIFTNNRREGIFVTGTATPLIQDNVFTKNSGNGISASRTSKGEIRNNLFQDTGFAIALGETASPLITDNRIIENVDGIVVAFSATPRLRQNVIKNNKRDGVVAVSGALPDLGTQDNPGKNIIRYNGRYDLNNATHSNTLAAYANDIEPKHIFGSVTFVPTTLETSFADIQSHWAQAYIEALAAKNIISGDSDGTFRPSDRVTRAEFAAIINKAFAPVPERPGANFVDVRSDLWAYKAIQAAYQGGFLSGYPGQVFRPDDHISRVDVIVSLASGLKLLSNNQSVLSVYSDASQIPNYGVRAVAGATEKQLVVNYPTLGQLNPNREATRAEVAAFIYQALVNSGRAEAIPSQYLVKISQLGQ